MQFLISCLFHVAVCNVEEAFQMRLIPESEDRLLQG